MKNIKYPSAQAGVSLVEAIVFIVVISIALGALINVFSFSVLNSVDPVSRVRALEIAQAQMDEILARKFDENTPAGGVPACDSAAGVGCLGIVPDGDFDDVGDYHGLSDNSNSYHTVSVSVTNAGTDIGLAATRARLIAVSVTIPGGDSLTISAYRVNF